jgi:hypothetical protein
VVEVVVLHRGMPRGTGRRLARSPFVSFARKLDPHAVVTVVIAIAIFCIVLPLADHPAALGTMDFIIRIIDVMTRVVLTNLLLDLHIYVSCFGTLYPHCNFCPSPSSFPSLSPQLAPCGRVNKFRE